MLLRYGHKCQSQRGHFKIEFHSFLDGFFYQSVLQVPEFVYLYIQVLFISK